MAKAKLPRSNGQARVVISGPVWDEICERIEWLEGLAVADGTGLELHPEPGGPVIAGGGRGGAAEDIGQYQYMVKQVVAQRQVGFDWERASPTV